MMKISGRNFYRQENAFAAWEDAIGTVLWNHRNRDVFVDCVYGFNSGRVSTKILHSGPVWQEAGTAYR